MEKKTNIFKMTTVYLGEADFNIRHIVDRMTFKEALNSDQADEWL